jgi:outer membrane protein assembly factor BamE (lipoprotein component of BamABCDE complex)
MPSRHLWLLCCAIACGALLGGCQPGENLTKANVDEVLPGMAKKQVESILGLPTTVDVKEYAGMKKTTYVYTQGKDHVTLVFWEDRLESKETSLTD